MSGINQVDIEQEIQHGIGAGLGGISGRGSAKPTIKLQVFTGEGWHIKFNIGLVSFRRLVSFRFKSDVSFVQIVGHVSNTCFRVSFVIRNYGEWVLRCGEVYVRPQYKKG